MAAGAPPAPEALGSPCSKYGLPPSRMARNAPAEVRLGGAGVVRVMAYSCNPYGESLLQL